MGSIISKIYDDYDAYREICQILKTPPEAIDKFYSHQNNLLSQLGFKDIYEFFVNHRRLEIRNKKIDDIIK
jgi:hypothetical protein